MGRALVPAWILEQVQLMILLRVPPRTRLENLRDNRFPFGSKVLGLHFLCHPLRNCLLFRRVCEYC